jgi:hypothetical protein
MKDIRCMIGWHRWTWKLMAYGVIELDAPPPDHATCSRCGIRYKPE